MKQKLEIDTGLLKVGDRVRLIPDTITWKGELALQRKTGVVIECRNDGQRVTARFASGKLLMSLDAGIFERL